MTGDLFAVILQAQPGLGKSAVARALAEQLGALHIPVDEVLVRYHLDQAEGECIPLQNFVQANVLAMPDARRALAAGQPVVFDGNFYYEEQVDHLVDSLTQTTDLPTKPVVLTLVPTLEIHLVAEGADELSIAEAAGPAEGATVETTLAQVLEALTPHLTQHVLQSGSATGA